MSAQQGTDTPFPVDCGKEWNRSTIYKSVGGDEEWALPWYWRWLGGFSCHF